MAMFNKETLKNDLQALVAKVTFTKADGSIREMKCTLKASLLPEVKLVEAHVPRKQNDDVLAVWDLDNNAWRSFRLDSITDVEYI
jgi:hypothetical protein